MDATRNALLEDCMKIMKFMVGIVVTPMHVISEQGGLIHCYTKQAPR